MLLSCKLRSVSLLVLPIWSSLKRCIKQWTLSIAICNQIQSSDDATIKEGFIVLEQWQVTNVVLPILVLKHTPPNLNQGDKSMTETSWVHQTKLADHPWQPPYLLFGLKDITPEDIAGPIPRDIAEDFQVLGIMGDIEDPMERTTEKHTECGIQSRVSTGSLW